MAEEKNKKNRFSEYYIRFYIGLVILVIIIGIITSLSSSSKKNKMAEQPTQTVSASATSKYKKLTINARKEGENIVVNGETDLPNDSKLTIEIVRPTLSKGETEKGNMRQGWGNPIVRDGEYSASIKIDSNIYDWENNLTPDSECVVTASFHPNWYGEKIQNDEVLKLVGSQGENIDGDSVQTIGGLTDKPYKILETKATVDFPFKLIK